MTKSVFISSTSQDLKEYRQVASDVCLKLGFYPIDMQHFGAMGVGATEGSKRKIDEADVYIGIFAHRYGYTEEGYDRSVTEIEFDYAGELELDRLCFVVDPNYPWPEAGRDPENSDRLQALKQKIDLSVIRVQFTTVDDFAAKLTQSLVTWRDDDLGIPTIPDSAKSTSRKSRILQRRRVFLGVALLLVLLLIGAGIAYGVWQSRQPQQMTGDFNIAVVNFEEIPASSNPTIAPIISQKIFNALDAEYFSKQFGITVQVSYQNFETVSSSEEARHLAAVIHAQVIIYGTVTVVAGSDAQEISPRFYVDDSFRSDVGELTGVHSLELPMGFSKEDLANPNSQINITLQQRISILVGFTEGLAYLTAEKIPLANTSIRDAIQDANAYGGFKGQEVLYLFASSTARLLGNFADARMYADKALEINLNYGRAYIAQGNVYYDQGKKQYEAGDFVTAQEYFATAISSYQKAADLRDQPYGSFVTEKADTGVGQVYVIQYLIAPESKKADFAQKALTRFAKVTASYESTQEPRLKGIAGNAYYWSGVIQQSEGNMADAKTDFEQVLKLSDNSDLKKDSQQRLNEMTSGL